MTPKRAGHGGHEAAAPRGYDAAALERLIPEPAKSGGGASDRRSPFARDRARILHSSAFRRLAGKTQVVMPDDDALLRTRLTHSLEVAQLAREIGAALGCDPDVVDAAGLAHDLGHPPFGHNGESALNSVAAGIGGFEGNAQTLRILTRLEPKVADGAGGSAGLNLTRAALDATSKYPWPADGIRRKFGVYDQDQPVFAWMRDGRADERRCLEAQVMDWADDVAYSVHDVEDAVHAGLLDVSAMGGPERAQVCRVAARLYSPRTADELAVVLDDLLARPFTAGLTGFDGTHGAMERLKRATSELTGRFVDAAITATTAAAGGAHAPALSRYQADLAVPDHVAAECALLKAMAAHYVMFRPGAEEIRSGQRVLLTELVAAVAARAPEALDASQRAAYLSAPDDAARLRVVIDQVAQLTDSSATAWHRRLCTSSPAGPSAP
ncbi:MAG: deoxyguanosinetriphosphate triphosphohydrolase [Pseudonocardiales bacterium]|nr:deoxyguanosinetriphosphate triphosphohydrolase [Pseudonocardiales bacterium]